MSEAVLISGTLLGTREIITQRGGDPQALARAAGLPVRVFDEHDIFVPAGRIIDFLELAAQACAYPAFALLHARHLPLAPRGQRWMLMHSAPTVREALQDFVNLYGLYTDAGNLRTQFERGGLWLNYAFLPVGRWGETQIVLLTIARLCLFIGEILGRPWCSPQVLLRHTPADPRPFTEFFGAGVRFGQARDAFLVAHDTLAEHLATGPERAANSTGFRRRELVGAALQTQVKSLLGQLLRHEGDSLEAVGRALGLSGRTLQRRLNDAGTNFRELVDAVRADLAWRHIKRTDLSFALVAELLGYDSQAAFSRAFRRWYAVTPRVARRD